MRMNRTYKLLISGLCALFLMLMVHPTHAQDKIEYGIFDHLGAGISIGTDGIGVDVAAPLTNYFHRTHVK